ncbi:hypothetical protein Ddc_07902 [Ditylenchus destructor]|nr:hypothetical protein Ddc_07902 [Ditylenchus destructor]
MKITLALCGKDGAVNHKAGALLLILGLFRILMKPWGTKTSKAPVKRPSVLAWLLSRKQSAAAPSNPPVTLCRRPGRRWETPKRRRNEEENIVRGFRGNGGAHDLALTVELVDNMLQLGVLLRGTAFTIHIPNGFHWANTQYFGLG